MAAGLLTGFVFKINVLVAAKAGGGRKLTEGLAAGLMAKKTDIKVDGNNCAGRQTTAGLTSGLMAGLNEKN